MTINGNIKVTQSGFVLNVYGLPDTIFILYLPNVIYNNINSC